MLVLRSHQVRVHAVGLIGYPRTPKKTSGSATEIAAAGADRRPTG
jgi:hypothetical protein